MYEAGGGEFGDGDLLRILKDEEERPHMASLIHMCLKLGIKKDNFRTIDNNDAWEYFYELFSEVAVTRSREDIYAFFGSMLPPVEIDEHLAHIEQLKRKTA